MTDILIMIVPGGFYPIEAIASVPLKAQAKDHGELNPHIQRIEDISGNILWSREK